MKITKKTASYPLSAKSIDAVADEVQRFLEQIGTERKNMLSLKLTVENMLIRWMAHFGEEALFSLSTGSRYGKPYIRLTLEGESFDPIETNDDFGDVTSRLFAGLGLYPTYEYSKNTNIVSFKLKKRQSNPIVGLLAALVSAVLIGLMGMLAPEAVRTGCYESVLTPVYDAFIGVLTTVAGPMIFLSVAWGVYGIGDAATLGKIGKKMLSKYVGITFAVTAFAIAVFLPFSKLHYAAAGMDLSGIGRLVDLILGIFPQNIISPFLDGNTIQIILMAAVFGCIMLILENQTKLLATFTEQLNYIVQYLIEMIGKVIPFFIFIIVLRLIWSDSLHALANVWKPVVYYVLCALAATGITLLYIAIKEKVAVTQLIKKVFPGFLIALTTASSSAAFGTIAASCEYDLGVKSKITNFGLPLSIVLFKPVTAVSFVSYALFFAKQYDIGISVVWVISAMIVISILTVALPPIPGGAIACYTILFMQLGIPAEALGIVIVLDIIADFINTGLNTIMRQCAIVLVAEQVNFLDKSTLQKEK